MDRDTLTAEQLANLTERLLGVVPEPGQTVFCATSPRGVVNVGLLEVEAEPDADGLASRLEGDADTVHLLGYGAAGAAQVRSWARALRVSLVGLEVGHTQQVQAGMYEDVDAPSYDVPVSRPAPDEVVRSFGPFEAATDGEVLERLTYRAAPGELGPEFDGGVRAGIALRASLSPAARAGDLENLLLSASDERRDIGMGLDDATVGLIVGMVRMDPVMTQVLTAVAIADDGARRELVDASRRAIAAGHMDLAGAAASAVWATSSDGLGPVSSWQTAAWLTEVEKIREGLGASIDPALTLVRVSAARGLNPSDWALAAMPLAAELVDDADREWTRAQRHTAGRAPSANPVSVERVDPGQAESILRTPDL
ncbi:hypothetical protein [Sanguibacter massiliensis]|uniref:hypothetical protein n=1 Tax=Sanguibacter massiliensis TaxID=1973217 RepID=UPI000C84B257|nr:hypothetical protein [Sanguibacter massiliensis]